MEAEQWLYASIMIAIALGVAQNTIVAHSGKNGSLKGIFVKTAYSGVISTGE